MRITMNASGNAYSAPKTQDGMTANPSAAGHRKYIWRDGDLLIARNIYAQFPERCIVCGTTEHCAQLPCTVRKPPGPLLLFLPVWTAFTPYTKANPYVCRVHRRPELRSRWLGRALLFSAIALFVGPLVMLSGLERPPTRPVFGLACCVPILYGWAIHRIIRTRLVRAKHIKGSDAWIPGIHPSVLDECPELP